MIQTIEICTLTGTESGIVELFQDYVINFFRSNNAVELLPQPTEWALMPKHSSPEIAEKASWSWSSRQREGGSGAFGSCRIYLKSDKQIRSKTSEKVIKDDAVYAIESTTSS